MTFNNCVLRNYSKRSDFKLTEEIEEKVYANHENLVYVDISFKVEVKSVLRIGSAHNSVRAL